MVNVKSIWVFHGTATSWGRDILRGLARFTEHREPWEFRVHAWGEAPGELPQNGDNVDGLILAVRDERQEQEIIDRGIPCVNVSGTLDVYRLPSVILDNLALGRMVADYLLNQGVRRFAYCGNDLWGFSPQRLKGFRQVVEEAGCECIAFEPSRREHLALGEQELAELAQWVLSLPKPIGLMACNDIRGRDVATACLRAGVRVPDDIAIVGVDNHDLMCTITVPPLSSVDTGAERVGYEAARLLDRLMSGERPAPEPLYVRPREVVVRRSSDVVAVRDELVAATLKFIKRRVDNNLTVAKVAEEMGVSRRLLERKFRTVLNRTVHNEIRRAQMDTARRLLVDTDMPLSEITKRCGFRYFSHFSQVCNEELHMPPGKYRRHFRLA